MVNDLTAHTARIERVHRAYQAKVKQRKLAPTDSLKTKHAVNLPRAVTMVRNRLTRKVQVSEIVATQPLAALDAVSNNGKEQ